MPAADTGRASISIAIAVAVRLYREGLATALRTYDHLHIEAAVGSLLEAQTVVRDREPDLLIVDVSLDGVENVMRTLRAGATHCRILAFAVREDVSTILDYAEAGADGFVTVNGSIAELVEAIERTAAGELLCSPRLAAQLLRRAAHQAPRLETGATALTSREQQVFSLIRQGLSNKEIGTTLNIAESTVKNHVHHLLEKLRVTTRAQAAATSGLPLKADLDAPPASPASRRAG
jgi:DNA-binding NarL/FixJ family response regulator